MVNKTSAYEQVTRQMVSDICMRLERLEQKFDDFDAMSKQMFNHLSSRLPWWATACFAGLASLCVGLIVRSVYG